VGLREAHLLSQKSLNVHRVCGKPMTRKKLLRLGQTECVPIVILDGPHNVRGNLRHAEESDTDCPARHSADLADGCGKAGQRQVLKQVMDETRIKSLGRSPQFKNVSVFEADAWE
jgi:hypothetical protein